MTLQNRVTPLGDLVADPARGLVYGNRGCLHDEHGRIRRRYATRRWIACRLEFKDWKRARLLQPGRFTELFFLDEATALAAGHRPCALCRRRDYDRFREIWAGCTQARETPTRSTGCSTRSGSRPETDNGGSTTSRSPSCRTARSSCTTGSPTSSSTPGFYAGRPRATAIECGVRRPDRRGRSRHRRSSPSCRRDGPAPSRCSTRARSRGPSDQSDAALERCHNSAGWSPGSRGRTSSDAAPRSRASTSPA